MTEDEIKNLKLLGEASVEAIQFALEIADEYDSHDAINFLEKWNEGSWQDITNYYPEFDLNSEAQQMLIKESGGF